MVQIRKAFNHYELKKGHKKTRTKKGTGLIWGLSLYSITTLVVFT